MELFILGLLRFDFDKFFSKLKSEQPINDNRIGNNTKAFLDIYGITFYNFFILFFYIIYF